MKKIVGYRYQCPKCGYTYKLYNGGTRPAADYLCPIHKIVMPAATIEQCDDTMAPVVSEDVRGIGQALPTPLSCTGCLYEREDDPDCMHCSRVYSDGYTPK